MRGRCAVVVVFLVSGLCVGSAVLALRTIHQARVNSLKSTLLSMLSCLQHAQQKGEGPADGVPLTDAGYRALMERLHECSIDLGECRWNRDGVLVDPWGKPLQIKMSRGKDMNMLFEIWSDSVACRVGGIEN